MRALFLPTVDCDHARDSSIELRQQSLDALLEVFADTGAAGHTTWFLNETYHDYMTTDNHPEVVHEAVRRGDCVGVHDHIDLLRGRWEFDSIYEMCAESKQLTQAWLQEHGYDDTLRAHRFGCLFQHPEAYRAIAELGYTIVSNIYPGDKSPNHTGYPSYDNESIPVGIAPYRHGVENFLDYTSTEGRFLEFPVTQMYFKQLEVEKARHCIEVASERGDTLAVLVLCFHPYELLGGSSRDELSPERVERLRDLFRGLVDELGGVFASAEEAAKDWEAHEAGRPSEERALS